MQRLFSGCHVSTSTSALISLPFQTSPTAVAHDVYIDSTRLSSGVPDEFELSRHRDTCSIESLGFDLRLRVSNPPDRTNFDAISDWATAPVQERDDEIENVGRIGLGTRRAPTSIWGKHARNSSISRDEKTRCKIATGVSPATRYTKLASPLKPR